MLKQNEKKRLDTTISSWLANRDKELEIRFYIQDFDTYKLIYETLYEKSLTSSISQTLNTIIDTGKDQTDRKEIYFTKGKNTSEKYIRKCKDSYVNIDSYPIKFQVSTASETEIPSFSNSAAKQIRLKLRSSLTFSEPEYLIGWRADFTLVKIVNKSDFSNIKTIKESIFPTNVAPDESKFLDNAYDVFEFELERVSDADISASNIDECINLILNIIYPDRLSSANYHNQIHKIASLLLDEKSAAGYASKLTLKQLANQPNILDFNIYRTIVYPIIEDYWISDKADGQRCFVWVSNNSIIVLESSTYTTYEGSTEKTYLFDAELLKDGEKNYHILIFDILIYQDITVISKSFNDRVLLIEPAIKEIKIPKNTGLTFEKKIMEKLTKESFSKQIKKMYERKSRLYNIDGLIFTPGSKSDYFNMTVYKWKPSDKQTIDFLVMKAPENILGIKPYEKRDGYDLMFLFTGISRSQYEKLNLIDPRGYADIFKTYNFNSEFFPAAFTPAANPYAYLYYHSNKSPSIDGHVAEFGWNGEWIFHQMRPDRDTQVEKGIGFGNNFQTADIIYNEYSNPFTLDKLLDPENYVKDVYFTSAKSDAYKPLTKFNSFVKSQILRQLENADWVIDLAAGKGQDLFTLHGYGVKNMLFVDIDAEAISELNKRKYNLGNSKLYPFGFHPAKDYHIYTKVLDLSQPFDESSKKISDVVSHNSADGIIINFAIHYLIKDNDSLMNLKSLIDQYIKPGGLFIFTCFDGNRLFDFLKTTKKDESIDLGEKYSIKKLYNDTKFKSYGLKISAIHPFSSGQYYEENLVDIANILNVFKKSKYTVLQYGSFGDWLDKYKQKNSKFDQMDQDDKIYASLYSYITLVKA